MDENQEFSLEDILKEFGDESEQIQEQTPEQILSRVENELLKEQGIEIPTEEAAEPEEESSPVQTSEEAAISGETIRFEAITDVHGVVRNAVTIDDEDDSVQIPAALQETSEPFSEQWEPEYEQPIAEYVPHNPIPFRPRSRLRELKKKLMEGPEKMYYEMTEKGLIKIQLAILASLLVVLISAGATTLHALDMVPESRLRLMVFWQFFAMLLAALLGSFQLIEGVTDLLKRKISLNTMLVFTFLLCCIDGILCLNQLRIPCCAAFSLQVTMSLWCTYQKRNTKMGQLDTMRKATQLDSVTVAEDYYDGQKALLRGEGQVEDFMDTLDTPCRLEKVLSVYVLVAMGMSIAAGIVAGILHGISAGIQVASVTTLASLPASVFVALSRPMAVLERRHHALGVVLCGWQGVEGLNGKALFPLSNSDLFPVGAVRMNGVKFFGSRQPDQIVAYAAALVGADGGSLEPLFTHLLDSRNGRHYTVEEFNPYGGGGIGGQVNGEAVLVGSTEFLQTMGVEIPEGIRIGQAVCAAIDGELCGLFAIAYEKDKASSAGVNTLCGYRGLNPVITTGDFMITETFIRDRFDVKTKRMLFPDFAQRAELREKKPEEEAPACALMTRDGLAPAAYAVTGARSLKSAATAGVIVHMIGGGLGIAMMLVLGILGATELLTPGNMFLYELALMVPGLIITEWTRSL